MRFWDASAVVPMLCSQASTAAALRLRDEDPRVVTWAWTPVECVSALRRLSREGVLTETEVWSAVRRMDQLRDVWTEVLDVEAVRRRAERCLHVHPLRAADAGQLAAALVVGDQLGRALPFVTFDGRLAEAARREGLEVLGI
ncbi:MAG: type II toxin-antitoxin system VapC family toxin [Bradymonadia bacterium]|jgi:predicted nucleic acid-binding protein